MRGDERLRADQIVPGFADALELEEILRRNSQEDLDYDIVR